MWEVHNGILPEPTSLSHTNITLRTDIALPELLIWEKSNMEKANHTSDIWSLTSLWTCHMKLAHNYGLIPGRTGTSSRRASWYVPWTSTFPETLKRQHTNIHGVQLNWNSEEGIAKHQRGMWDLVISLWSCLAPIPSPHRVPCSVCPVGSPLCAANHWGTTGGH